MWQLLILGFLSRQVATHILWSAAVSYGCLGSRCAQSYVVDPRAWKTQIAAGRFGHSTVGIHADWRDAPGLSWPCEYQNNRKRSLRISNEWVVHYIFRSTQIDDTLVFKDILHWRF